MNRPQDIQFANADGSLTRIDFVDFMPRYHRKRLVRKRRWRRAREEFGKAVRKFHQRANPCGLPYVYEMEDYVQLALHNPGLGVTVAVRPSDGDWEFERLP